MKYFEKSTIFQFHQTLDGLSKSAYSENIGSFLNIARTYFPPGKQYGLVLNYDVNSMEDSE